MSEQLGFWSGYDGKKLLEEGGQKYKPDPFLGWALRFARKRRKMRAAHEAGRCWKACVFHV